MADAGETGRGFRALPQWAWALAIIFHPLGLFIALGAARAIKWSSAILLAAASYVLSVAFVWGMIAVEGLGIANEEVNLLIFLGLLFYLISVAQLQYALGNKSGIWTPRAKRAWRAFGYVAAVSVLIVVAALVVRLLFSRSSLRIIM